MGECLCGPSGPRVDRRTSTSTRHPSHVQSSATRTRRTGRSHRTAKLMVLYDRPEVEASRRRGRRGGRRSVPPGGLRLPRDARRRGPRPEVRVGRIFATSGPRCGVAVSESIATPHTPKEVDVQRGGRARRLVCAPPPFSRLSPVNTEAVGGRICHLAQGIICSRRQPKN